jgi:O-antigen biosynthesis protein
VPSASASGSPTSVRPTSVSSTHGFEPIRVIEVELSTPIGDIEPTGAPSGRPFTRARVLARIHTRPLGFVDVALDETRLAAATLLEAIRSELGTELDRHLAADGLTERDVAGPRLGGDGGHREPAPSPRCLEARDAVLRDPPSVTVVIPTVDRPEALRRCLVGLSEQSYPDFDIVVVDNAPGESGAERVVAQLAPKIPRLRRLVEPRRGASRARNRGAAEAEGQILAFIDGDVRPDRSWLAATITALVTPVAPATTAAAPGTTPACVTGAILPGSLDTRAQVWMEEWGGYSKGFEQRSFDLGEHRPPGPLFPYAIAACGSGASLALPASQFRQLGGFDPALGGGTPARSGEDLALLLDVVMAGGTIAYEPAAIVWHDHPASDEGFRQTMRNYGIGLTAYLTRHVLRHPSEVAPMAAVVPAAAAYFLRRDSDRNRRRSATFPRWIWAEEVAGMLSGPLAYAAGRGRALAGSRPMAGPHSGASR